MDNYFLVNIVHNDFKDSDAIFEPFFRVGESKGLPLPAGRLAKQPNGVSGAVH